jgi:beta-lactamase class A
MSKVILMLPVFLAFLLLGNTPQLEIYPMLEEEASEETPLQPLRALADTELQTALETVLFQNPQWRSLIRQKKMAVSFVEMSQDDNPRLAAVNGDHMMYAASLPKIAVLLASMDAIEKGELIETPAVTSDMRLMIARSNNAATTRMIDRLGFAKIQEVMTDPAYKLYDPEQGGGIWVGKRYGSGGGRNPDPMKGLSHAATTTQVCRFYYLMAKDQLVNEQRSAQMRSIMADPELHHKFVNTLDRIAPQATVYRKSGSWKTYHSDSVMVMGPKRQYILSALIDDEGGEVICRELVMAIEKVLASTPG